MPALEHFIIASLNFTQQANFKDAAQTFLADRSLVWSWLSAHWDEFTQWLSQPHVLAVVMAWWIAFTVIMTLMMAAGFGPTGIIAGSLAAAFQSWMYGGFTPAGGVFATLTSVGMLGVAMPMYAVGAAGIATIVAVIVGVFFEG